MQGLAGWSRSASRSASRWWWRTRWLRTLWRDRVGAALLGLGLTAAALEVGLRIPSLPLSPGLTTALFQCYTSEYEDENIGFESAKLGIRLPKPNVDRSCAWLHYRWHHHGDKEGFRNPRSAERADIVLVGDSFVYGHGVEEDETFAHFMREDTGLCVVNLGWTGDSPVQYLARLRNYALPLHPRVVVVFFFANDLTDILTYRSADAIRRFVATGEAREASVFARAELDAEYRGEARTVFSELTEHLLSFRAARYSLQTHPLPPKELGLSQKRVPGLDEIVTPEGDEPIALEYLGAATALMARSARDARVRLAFATLPAFDGDRRGQLVRTRVRAAAEAAGVPFLDATASLVVDGYLRDEDFLAYDLHLSSIGHRRVARIVEDFLRDERLLESP